MIKKDYEKKVLFTSYEKKRVNRLIKKIKKKEKKTKNDSHNGH